MNPTNLVHKYWKLFTNILNVTVDAHKQTMVILLKKPCFIKTQLNDLGGQSVIIIYNLLLQTVDCLWYTRATTIFV